MQSGVFRYPPMDSVIYGKPFAEALAGEAQRLGANAVYVLAGRTLSRETDVLAQLREALGNKLAGVTTEIGAHTPRNDVVAAANAARAAGADLLATVGSGSVTDAAKMVGLCLGNDVSRPEQLDAFRAETRPDGNHPSPAGGRPVGAVHRRAGHAVGRGVHRLRRLHGHHAAGEGKLRASADDAAHGYPRSRHRAAHAALAVPVHRHPRG